MNLKIAKGLGLPISAVTEKLAWLGTTGGGKTYAAMKMAEMMWDAGAQFVVLDPVGVWYGLRLKADGRTPSDINIPIFGGLHGDVPIDSTSGTLIADLVVDRRISVVIDVSQFESDAQKARFAAGFMARFFFRMKASPAAVHLFLEECQEFVPQNPAREENQMLHEFVRTQKLGRNFGIGSSYISQRPQEINKKALNLAQTLFVFRSVGVHERKRIEEWIKDKALDIDIAADLPKLPTGRCHVWSPVFLKVSEQVQILEKRTFNASATPEVGAKAVARHLAPIDLERIKKDIAATIERAKSTDPRSLLARIAELEKMKAPVLATTSKVKTVEVAVPVFKKKDVQAIKEASKELGKAHKKITAIHDAWGYNLKLIGERINALITAMVSVTGGPSGGAVLPKFQPKPLAQFDRATGIELHARQKPHALAKEILKEGHPGAFVPASESPHTVTVRAGERKILTAIAQHQDGVTREQITVLTGYKRSSRDTYLQRLNSQGLIRMSSNGIYATEAGMQALGAGFSPLPTGDALRKYWLENLPTGERNILAVLVKDYPGETGRDTLGELTGYKRSSRDTYLQRLLSRQLITVTGRGSVKASGILFD